MDTIPSTDIDIEAFMPLIDDSHDNDAETEALIHTLWHIMRELAAFGWNVNAIQHVLGDDASLPCGQVNQDRTEIATLSTEMIESLYTHTETSQQEGA